MPAIEPEKRARIGVAKRVHILEKFKKTKWRDGDWGSSLCGWAGVAKLTKDFVTCKACRWERLKQKEIA